MIHATNYAGIIIHSHIWPLAVVVFLLAGEFNANNFARAAEPIKLLEPTPRPIGVPSDKTLLANGAIIGDIIYSIGDIFDTSNPKENYYFFRLANRLHINTKQFVVRDDLLFNTGDAYSPELLSESERILRSKNYLFDAHIRPVHYENNRVDIEVKTRDVWTLSGGINYSRKGGENSYGFMVQEDNFAGLGKGVRIRRDTNEFRTETEFQYRDPFITPQRYQLTIGYSYNSDGRSRLFQLQRPFYSLETRWAVGINGKTFSRQETLYKDGEKLDSFYQDEEFYELRGGFSRGLIGDYTSRWQLGFTQDKNRFTETADTINPDSVPQDRDITYPWIQYDGIVSRYIKTSQIDFIGRTEDINLGANYDAQLGWAHSVFGSHLNALVFDIDYQNYSKTFSDHLMEVNISSSGRVGNGFSQNLLLSGELRYFNPVFTHQVFYTELDFDIGHNLDGENQLLLGGDTGLRGYPTHIQDGNRRLLFKMEQRYYSGIQLLQLAYIAGAAFFDIGKAWTPGAPPGKYSGFLKDVGMGLRLAPSRTSQGIIIHIDLAYALDAEVDGDKVQLVVSTESRF